MGVVAVVVVAPFSLPTAPQLLPDRRGELGAVGRSFSDDEVSRWRNLVVTVASSMCFATVIVWMVGLYGTLSAFSLRVAILCLFGFDLRADGILENLSDTGQDGGYD